MSHWCRDIPRDEAVRAAEDGRSGPLPTLAECIERQKHAAMTAGVKEGFVKADGEWKRLTDDELRQLLVIPKSVSATSAPEQENKGDSMADRAEIARAGQFAPPEAPQGPKCTERESGLRTELVTLEVTHRFADPIARVLLGALDSVLSGQGESVFVMDGSCEITKLTDERDAAIRERDMAKQHHARECAKCVALADKVIGLRACVAELEAAVKLAPAANADAVSNPRPISGAGKSAGEETQEPDAWGVRRKGGVDAVIHRLFRSSAEASAEQYGGIVVPLYAAPQPAPGWLTAEERETLLRISYSLDYVQFATSADFIRSLLARSSPPEVVLPRECDGLRYDSFVAGWNGYRDEVKKALADAGVKWKEVGRE